MDFSVVLNHLQNQFSGQMVLYANDIAKVLGKSEKSIAHLITRDKLPFKVKMLGGLRCVDIFQVAQWLASDQKVAEEVVVAPPKAGKTGKGVVAVKGPKMHQGPEVAAPKPTTEAQSKPGGNQSVLDLPADKKSSGSATASWPHQAGEHRSLPWY